MKHPEEINVISLKRAILKTEPNSANRIQTFNTLAIPVVTYSFNIISWDLSDIKIRKFVNY